MSAIEWLSFITPFVWILLALNVCAMLPIHLKKTQPSRVKFTFIVFVITVFGWFMAVLATHIMQYPVARINVLQMSQVILTPTLILLAVLLIVRLFQGENALITLLKGLGRLLKPILHLFAFAIPTILRIFSSAYIKHAHEQAEHEEDEYEKVESSHRRWHWWNKN